LDFLTCEAGTGWLSHNIGA